MEPAWESERGTNFRLSQIREKISNKGYNRLPNVFTKEDVIRCFGYDNPEAVRKKIYRLTQASQIEIIKDGEEKGKYRKLFGSMYD